MAISRSKINLKLNKEVRDTFHEIVKEKGLSMQAVLESFVKEYNKDPNKFLIKMEVQ